VSQKYLHVGRKNISVLIKKSHAIKTTSNILARKFSNGDPSDVPSTRKCTINMLVLPQDTVWRMKIGPTQQANVF
jgi:hypothetical protein